ncbi:MAG: tetratricopeptide repeat protein [Candidatus Eisenbacteria bacterium]|nr:tetratricopeptide repeat protein [Candidatus Eisenbacteria bacterium]
MRAKSGTAGTTFAQKLLLILFGVGIVFLAEGVLRLAGVGGRNSLYVRDTDSRGRRVFVANESLNRRLFFPVTGERSNFPRPQLPYAVFPVEKDARAFRVFVVGASSVAAMPYAPNASFAAFLREALAEAMPDRRVEGINTSMTAVSSYQIADWVDEILDRYDPDLVVVYTGHNEFYGVLGAGSSMSVGSNRSVARLFLHVQKTSLYSLVAGFIEKARRPPDEARMAQPFESLTRDRAIRLESELHRSVERNFRRNLEEMAQRAERAGVPIVFCAPASNRASCAPLGPVPREDLSTEEESMWSRLVQTGDSYSRLGEHEKALREYLAALAIDSTHAALLYRLGLLHRDMESAAEARNFLDRALLRDGVRLRASDRIVDVVRSTARAHESKGIVHLADIVRRFADESPKGLTGSNLILEHVHLNGRGHHLAAEEILETLLRARVFPNLNPERRLPFEEACRRVAFSAIDEAYAASFMMFMLDRWPFKDTYRNEEQIRFMRERFREERAKLDPVAREVLDTHPPGSTALHLRHRLGAAYLEAGEYEKAAGQFGLLAEMLPFLVDVQKLLARAQIGAGRFEDAERAAREAVHLSPNDPEGSALLASALAGQGRREEAKDALESARRNGLGEIEDPLLAPLLNF